MKKRLFILLGFTIFSLFSISQKVPSADEVLKTAYQQAARENKNVLLLFHASWCGWCRAMDSSIKDPAVRDYFERNFVLTHLTVLESANKKNMENPGAEDFLNRYGGKDNGLPFWIILDAQGSTLGDSRTKDGKNVGCPATEAEVAHLISVLEKNSRITNEEKSAVKNRFRKNEL
jgi:thioredoxin-related protein